MKEPLKVVCPNCLATNRVAGDRLSDRPRCGGCKQALFLSSPLELNSRNFDKTLSANQIPVVVEFWAPWCGYCRRMEPVFRQAAAQLEPRYRLGKLNIEAEPAIASRFGVQSVPTTILFKNGAERARQMGAMDLGALVRWVQSHS